MGVPAFFTWLIKRYPLILSPAKIQEMPIIDCLYLDMNGILYQCARDEKVMFKDLLQDKNYNELWAQIFNKVNNIVNNVAPNKILFLGLDGPAPRAKQNQQRSRRFQSAKGYEELNKALQNCGFFGSENTFKNNSISPGTEFMHELNQKFKFFIARKFKEDQKWKNLRVIFSGSNVPGEGEHKILSYMREYTSAQDYDPKTTHCIYGADADLIMLGLSTHIPYVSILREILPPKYQNTVSPAVKRNNDSQEYQIIYLNILREYMDLEFSDLKMQHLQYNIDSIIDDFILLCFFVGNDFLPKCYCFDIRQGHIEELIDSYKEMLNTAKSYINVRGQINWQSMEQLLVIMSRFEKQFIKNKAEDIEDAYNRNKWYENDDVCDDNLENSDDENDTRNKETFEYDQQQTLNQEINKENKQLTDYDQQQIEKKREMIQLVKQEKEFLSELVENLRKDDKFGKQYYYKHKLDFDFQNNQKESNDLFQLLIQKYLEGLQFVLQYYYQGCPSWSWYYPFYYSPLVSDLLEFVRYKNSQNEQIEIKFDKGKPYEPLKQLMCILHPENFKLLPDEFAKLITDPQSPLRSPIDYYPSNFKIDPYGGVFEHEFIVQLPFLDENILNKAYEQIDMKKLNDYDKSRNQIAQNIIYTLNPNPKAQKKEIVSDLPFYGNFQIALDQYEFSLDKMVLCQTKPLVIDRNFDPKKVHIFPSLYTKKIIGNELQEIEKKDCITKRLFLKLEEEFKIPEVTPREFVKVYTNYPSCEETFVIGWMDEEKLYKIKPDVQIDVLSNMHYKKDEHSHIFDYMYDKLEMSMKDQGLIIQNTSSQKKIIFLREYKDIERTLNGNVEYNKEIYNDLTNLTTSFSQYPRMKKRCEIKNFKSIQEEFPLESNVISLDQQFLGYKGIVKGYLNDKQSTQIKVQLLQQPYRFSQDQYNNLTRDKTPYYSIKYIAEELKIDTLVLIHMLDEVVVYLDEKKESSTKLKKKLDIGLKFISRYLNQIVPELVRVPDGVYDLNLYEQFQQFNNLEVSYEGTNIIRNYFDIVKNTNLFKLIKRKIKEKKRVKIDVQELFIVKPEERDTFDPNISLVKIYIWIMQHCQASLLLAPINGKVMAQRALEDFKRKHKKPIYMKDIQLYATIDPNFLQRQCDYVQIPLYFNNHPFDHQIGDRVINLNATVKPNSPPFGAVGTVIGVINTQIQVIFDEPFIGGTNLGGKCEWLRGGLLDFLDVFNLEGDYNNTWEQFLEPRDKNNQMYGWNRMVQPPELFYETKAIKNKEFNDQFVQKFKKQNPFQNLDTQEQQQQQQQDEDEDNQNNNNSFKVAGKKQKENKFLYVIKQDNSQANQSEPINLEDLEKELGDNQLDQNNQNQEQSNQNQQFNIDQVCEQFQYQIQQSNELQEDNQTDFQNAEIVHDQQKFNSIFQNFDQNVDSQNQGMWQKVDPQLQGMWQQQNQKQKETQPNQSVPINLEDLEKDIENNQL